MAFLDNSGDIILDAVLTDTGRKLLARGDGTFRIIKFALSDEEINYGIYDPNAPAGQEDLQIMQTPILEAFTNNSSLMHSFLQTYTNNETLLYMPVLKLNTLFSRTNINSQFNSYLVAVDQNTACALSTDGDWTPATQGIWYGYDPDNIKTFCRIDQGIDNTLGGGPQAGFPTNEMYENQYQIEIDSRFGQIIDGQGATLANPSFIDDDGIAVYFLSTTADPTFVMDNTVTTTVSNNQQVIAGPRGSILEFQIQVSNQLQTTTSLFTQLGGEFNAAHAGAPAGPVTCYYIDSIVRVTGLTTGYTIDVPIRYVRARTAYNCVLTP